jgi:hypothetical protein
MRARHFVAGTSVSETLGMPFDAADHHVWRLDVNGALVTASVSSDQGAVTELGTVTGAAYLDAAWVALESDAAGVGGAFSVSVLNGGNAEPFCTTAGLLDQLDDGPAEPRFVEDESDDPASCHLTETGGALEVTIDLGAASDLACGYASRPAYAADGSTAVMAVDLTGALDNDELVEDVFVELMFSDTAAYDLPALRCAIYQDAALGTQLAVDSDGDLDQRVTVDPLLVSSLQISVTGDSATCTAGGESITQDALQLVPDPGWLSFGMYAAAPLPRDVTLRVLSVTGL